MKLHTNGLRILAAVVLLAAGFLAGRAGLRNNEAVVNDPRHQQPTADLVFGQVATIENPRSGRVITVENGGSIQSAVLAAQPGDTIRVRPGTYHETVYVDKDGIALTGSIEHGEWPTLDGEGTRNDAILYSGNGITVENFAIMHYKGNGVMGQAGNNFVIRNNIITDAGVYGIFPQFGQNGVITNNILSGIADAAIYVGMSDNVHVAHNEVFGNVAGIEIENSRHAIVEGNYAHDNTSGILVFITPGLPIKTTYDVIVRNNFVIGNNHPNFGAAGSIVAGVPAGTGILVMAADDVRLEGNIITGNDNVGIAITDHGHAANLTLDPESEPNSDQIAILDNTMQDNGKHALDEIKALMLTKLVTGGADIVRVGDSKGSCILHPERHRTYGVDDFAPCGFTTTADTRTYLLTKPVAPREIAASEKGKAVYFAICSGCHAYNVRLIGPPTQAIQAIYLDNPQGIADFIAQPSKKRPDYPEMPPQAYLDEPTRRAVAEFMLGVTK
jgi:parallel beta-helix repeat protein